MSDVTAAPVLVNGPSTTSSIVRSRLDEKAEMQNNNNRLAALIDSMQSLRDENIRLSTDIETMKAEILNSKTFYDNELTSKRKRLEELSSEKAKLEIDVARLMEEKKMLSSQLEKKYEEVKISEHTASNYEMKYNQNLKKYGAMEADLKKKKAEAKAIKEDLQKERKQLNECRKNLQNEMVARINLENCVRSLREEMKFKESMYNEELNQSRARQTNVSEHEGRLAEERKLKFETSIRELRDEYEGRIDSSRSENESLIGANTKNLQICHERELKAKDVELEFMRIQLDASNVRIDELEQVHSLLSTQSCRLQSLLNSEQVRAAEGDGEINRLREEIAVMTDKYMKLMATKMSMEFEFATYGRLSSVYPIAKRSRREYEDADVDVYIVSSSSVGKMEIVEINAAEKLVKLHNRSETELSLNGWKLQRKIGANENVFEFDPIVKVDAGSDIIVCSADSSVASDSAQNVIVDKENWSLVDEMKATLINDDGYEEATMQRNRQERSQTRRNVCVNARESRDEAKRGCFVM